MLSKILPGCPPDTPPGTAGPTDPSLSNGYLNNNLNGGEVGIGVKVRVDWDLSALLPKELFQVLRQVLTSGG